MNNAMMLLKKQGIRATPARLQLLAALSGAEPERLTAEQVFMRIADSGASVSLASVYRVLKELSLNGLVDRGWCQDGQEVRLLFSLRRNDTARAAPELFCVSCHRSMVLKLPELRQALNAQGKKNRLQAHDRPIVIHITCGDCA